MSMNENNNDKIIQERWEVVKSIDYQYRLNEGATYFPYYSDFKQTDGYFLPVLKWLYYVKKVITIYSPYDVSPNFPITMGVDEKKFTALFNKYKRLIEEIKSKEKGCLGTIKEIELVYKSNQIRWFDPDGNLLGKCVLGSKSINLLDLLWGAEKKIPYREAIMEIWSERSYGPSGIADKFKIPETKIKPLIDYTNMVLSKSLSPIFITQRSRVVYIKERKHRENNKKN